MINVSDNAAGFTQVRTSVFTMQNNCKTASFFGLEENISAAKEAVQAVKEEYPQGFHSATHYKLFEEHPNADILYQYEQEIYKTRDIMDFKERTGADRYAAVEYAVKKTGAANCGEQAVLVSKALRDKGISNKVISMVIYKNNTYLVQNDHTFCVIGLDDDCNIQNPETWGDDAVIADIWSGVTDKAQEALDFFKKLLKFDNNKSCIKYINAII